MRTIIVIGAIALLSVTTAAPAEQPPCEPFGEARIGLELEAEDGLTEVIMFAQTADQEAGLRGLRIVGPEGRTVAVRQWPLSDSVQEVTIESANRDLQANNRGQTTVSQPYLR